MNAAATGEALKGELAARKEELNKIDSLGIKISAELGTLKARLAAMQQEVETYGAVDAAKSTKEASRAGLEGQKADLTAKRDAIKVKGLVLLTPGLMLSHALYVPVKCRIFMHRHVLRLAYA